MNRDEAQLDFPFGDRLPLPGAPMTIAPGIGWLRMPLPFALDHINLWLLRDRFEGREGWTLVDCGVATTPVRALWDTVLADGLDDLPIVRVLVTHMHPDHVGMADVLTRRFDAPLWMTRGEYLSARLFNLVSADESSQSVAAHFELNGGQPEWIDALRRGGSRLRYRELVPSVPVSYVRIEDDQEIRIGNRTWRVVVGHGHSPEHAALWCPEDGLLISGDMVLPRISTNVSVFDTEPLADPLGDFLASLKRFEACTPDTLTLPSHGRPFRRLQVRIDQLRRHHDDRLAALSSALRNTAMSAAEAVAVVFPGRRFEDQQRLFATGEALAHLHALWHSGNVQRQLDPDGRARFSAVTADPDSRAIGRNPVGGAPGG